MKQKVILCILLNSRMPNAMTEHSLNIELYRILQSPSHPVSLRLMTASFSLVD